MKAVAASLCALFGVAGCAALPVVEFSAPTSAWCSAPAMESRAARSTLRATDDDAAKAALLAAIDSDRGEMKALRADGASAHPDSRAVARLMVDAFAGSTTSSAIGVVWRSALGDDNASAHALSMGALHREMLAIGEVIKSDSWTEVRRVIDTSAERAAPRGSNERKVADAASRRTQFLAAYARAYFRSGNVFTVKVDQKAFREHLTKALLSNVHLNEQEARDARAAVEQLAALLCTSSKCPLIDRDDETVRYVSRAGHQYGFPSVAASIDPGAAKPVTFTKIDELALIGDVVRLVIEAAFDADTLDIGFRKTSTACAMKASADAGTMFDAVACFTSTDKTEVANFNRVYQYADAAEALTGVAVAQAIRGFSVAALNNEALARLVETSIAVTVRKKTEQAAWEALMCTSRGVEGLAAPTFTQRRVQVVP